jgi:superfamily II DNA/RNA helicase
MLYEVRRAGRTARANREGHCLTMLKKGQVGAFKKMRSTIGTADLGENSKTVTEAHAQIPKCRYSDAAKQAVEAVYGSCLSKLSKVLEMEASGRLNSTADITSSSFV